MIRFNFRTLRERQVKQSLCGIFRGRAAETAQRIVDHVAQSVCRTHTHTHIHICMCVMPPPNRVHTNVKTFSQQLKMTKEKNHM